MEEKTEPEAHVAALEKPRRRRARKVLLGLGAVVLVLVLAASVAAVVVVRKSFPETDGELTVAGLHGPVEVLRDDLGVPQVYADDARDLFLAQGYLHAQDRFWEMDVRRHITAGRLAELFGPSQLATDSVVRTMGWYDVATRELSLLSPSTRDYLDAYSQGVNAYLSDHEGAALSAEYAVLGLSTSGYRPQQWTPADSVAWLKAVAWDLNSGIDTEIQRSLLAATLPPERVEALYPPYDYSRFPSIVRSTVPGAKSSTGIVSVTGGGSALGGVSSLRETLTGVLGQTGPGIGSNSWVVAGSRTTTGAPMLANDPHLAPSMPGIWNQIGLHCTTVNATCPFDVTGFGFSGMPGVIVGHTGEIAWGLTNVGADDSDLFLEKVTGNSYEYRGEQVPLTVRQETIAVAGEPSRTIIVRSTRHGPLLSDVLPKTATMAAQGRSPGVSAAAGYSVALQWTALEPSRTMDAVLALDVAKDWTAFRQAVSLFSAPAQNMIYADRAGNIGYQMSGALPVRGQGDGSYPAAGWTGDQDWTGTVGFDRLPTVFNPPEGYIVTANNAAAPPATGPLVTGYWVPGYRAARISDLIEHAPGKLDAAAMARMQLDSYNPGAAELVPRLLAVDPGEGVHAAQNLLRGWDFQQPVDSAAAAYFNAVWRNLVRLTFGDDLAATSATAKPSGSGRWFDLVHRILDRPDDPWWRNATDPRNLRTRDDVLRAALQDAEAELRTSLGGDPAGWRWGELHTLTLRNQTLGTGGPAPVKWLLNAGPFPVPGGSDAVDATSWDASRGYEVTTGPSMRMVVDLADLDKSRWVNLTGESGHAFDANYQDQTELYLRGETEEWAFRRAAVRSAAKHTLLLRPA
ncbi:penicillin acylase family protein [Amycolatopsis sp. NPDC005232]|uniref:penicillin acylase family protein n=1 Tax=Amycolatopsis sp. NPDC005232 TaxID=3157027 RepID=UPI0033A4118F